jgi:hypothetical protein
VEMSSRNNNGQHCKQYRWSAAKKEQRAIS